MKVVVAALELAAAAVALVAVVMVVLLCRWLNHGLTTTFPSTTARKQVSKL